MKTEIKNKQFLLDGKPFRILSGEMHYFRIPREYWRDRLLKLKACGLNTVATYMPWNLHERTPGKFDFSGMLDVRAFLELADELGIKVLLRPGPYICSEWEFGGFPAWLLAVKGLRLRCSEPQYMGFVERYFKAVFEQVKEFYTRNIIMFQIENGYASYGNDMVYYNFLKKLVDDSGYQNVVIAADGDSDTRISNKIPDGVWRTLMCGRENPVPQLEFNQSEQPEMPQFIVEYWNGQHMSTGEPIRPRDPVLIVENLRKALEWGAHINLYMFHGGTNFGFLNGAMLSLDGWYSQLITSYDTAAPVSEAGDTRELYRMYRPLFAKYNPEFSINTPIPPDTPKAAYGEIALTEFAPLSRNLDALSLHATKSACPLTMEEIDGDYGFVRYTTHLESQSFKLPVKVLGLNDRGWVYYNGKFIRHIWKDNESFTIETGDGGMLEIVVENRGRTNFYCNIEHNRKSITDGVILNGQQFQHGWTTAVMPMEDTSKLAYGPLPEFPVRNNMGFFRAKFEIADTPADTFLHIPAGNRGFCRINGVILGRYDKNGPFNTLYVPAPFLRKSENVVEVFEYDDLGRPAIQFLNHPLIGGI